MGQHTCVVAIDDYQDELDTFTDLLKLKGINVVGKGRNGKEAATVYQIHRPDVVFLDIVMPQYDGWHGLMAIREINPDAKIIIVTGDATKKTHDAIKEFQPTAVLKKPYDIEQVIELVNQIAKDKNS